MYSQYRVTYQLRAHKRDALIEFIKSLLLTPFVLHLQPYTSTLRDPTIPRGLGLDITGDAAGDATPSPLRVNTEPGDASPLSAKRGGSHDGDPVVRRYSEIFRALEQLVDDHRAHQELGTPELSKLFRLVPSIGTFFTPLPLRDAFLRQNRLRSIAGRRNVPPSFNDVRHVLNSAQVSAISPGLKLVTFDGDLTLYEDGGALDPASPLIALMGRMMVDHGVHIAIVTAAGYTGPEAPGLYRKRLGPLLDHIEARFRALEPTARGAKFFVFGGESSYLFSFGPFKDPASRWELHPVPPSTWESLEDTASLLGLSDSVSVIRKPRAVGIVPKGVKLGREQLDEFALASQDALGRWGRIREARDAAEGKVHVVVPFCAFNGGSDVFIDIGSKLVGVQLLLNWLGLSGGECLHVGDQFLSTGNDVATRRACATVWIASPEETWACMSELMEALDGFARLPLDTLPRAPLSAAPLSAAPLSATPR
ncbi:IMP-specific 5-nucleotidase [Hyaloraphidium curvatum]|nr:IMP-specific 5-nucleotidase [Hyaloraphidium curvatum]